MKVLHCSSGLCVCVGGGGGGGGGGRVVALFPGLVMYECTM